MNDYDNTNTGALFKNQKDGHKNWPDYKGQINVGGKEFWLSAWIKKSKKGETFMSLSIQPKEAKKTGVQTSAPQHAPAGRTKTDGFEDTDIPFAPRHWTEC